MSGIPVLFENKNECSGCTACYAVCPVNAIVMSEDEEGFLYPVIDSMKCIRCHSCERVCPLRTESGIRGQHMFMSDRGV